MREQRAISGPSSGEHRVMKAHTDFVLTARKFHAQNSWYDRM
ncbi:MAG: hypothetical protein AAF639_07895 [Chloroflexota bacterium]